MNSDDGHLIDTDTGGILRVAWPRAESWWPRPESNQRHTDFQSAALPTELLGRSESCAGKPRIIASSLLRLAQVSLLQAVAETANGDDAHAARLEPPAQAVGGHPDRRWP